MGYGPRITSHRSVTPPNATQRQASPRIATYWRIAVLGAALARVPHAPFPPRLAALCEGPRPLRRIPTHRHPSPHADVSPNPAAHAPTARSQHPTLLCAHSALPSRPLLPRLPPRSRTAQRLSQSLNRRDAQRWPPLPAASHRDDLAVSSGRGEQQQSSLRSRCGSRRSSCCACRR